MKKIMSAIVAGCIACSPKAQPVPLNPVIRDAETQTQLMLSSMLAAGGDQSNAAMPRTLEKKELKLVRAGDWTSGFFPGQLWFLYEFTRNGQWKHKADSMTRILHNEQYNAGTHDMGFKIYCSYGNGYRLTSDAGYKEVIIQAAKTLATRFNKKVGAIRSWDHNRDQWQFPVIIDNMMNLELLFAAARLTKDSSYYKMAVRHADITMNNHFRENFSSFHVIDYDTVTGRIIQKNTHQGYADGSSWARGQAWGLYGYTMCYRETRDIRYLEQAQQIAAFVFNHPRLPKDLVPYWDYDDPRIPDAPRDASAAAIAASALYELAGYAAAGTDYKKLADQILISLTEKYRSAVNENKGFLLLHSTGHFPAGGEIDVPITYADYYYLEALLRSKTPIANYNKNL